MEYTISEIAEIVNYFKQNDITKKMSIEKSSDLSLSEAKTYKKALEYYKSYWNKNLENFGMKRKVENFSNDFPINFLAEKDGDYFSKHIAKIMENTDEFQKAIDQFFDMYGEQIYVGCEAYAESVNKNVDDLTDNEINYIVEKVAEVLDEEFIKAVMYGQQVPDIYNVARENSAHEDYAEWKGMENLDLVNFYNHWYHLKTKVGEMLSFESTSDDSHINGRLTLDSYARTYEYKILMKTFYESLDEIDGTIFCLKANGYTNKEIAEKLKYKSTSAVTKKLAKIKEKFLEFSNAVELKMQ